MQTPWIIAFVAQWLLLLALTLLVIGMLRYLVALEGRWKIADRPISSYEVGQRIDEFVLPDITGAKVRSDGLLADSEGAVILLISSSCPSCYTLLHQVAEIVTRQSIVLRKRIVVIVLGAGTSVLERLCETVPGLRDSQAAMLADENGVALGQFGVTSVPTGLAVTRQGRVIDQNLNPHVEDWLYRKLDIAAPVRDAAQKSTWVSIVARVAPEALRKG